MGKAKQGVKSVFITGGSSGIGEALVGTFAQAGYSVWFSFNRGEKRAKEIVKKFTKFSVNAIQMDQGNIESIDEAVSKLPKNLEIAILNAAVGTKTVEAYAKETENQDLALMQINALGPMWITSRLLTRMKSLGYGKIVFVSSVDGGINYFSGARYADGMSKAALTQFAKQLASELVHEPLDIFTICPGATETPMLKASQLNHLSEKEKQTFSKALPGGRLIVPQEIADLALFLCTPVGQTLRGAVIDASLGLGNNPSAIKRTNFKGGK